ncbi:MAG: hypothetical protein AAGK98_15285 [Pseudomonadota bacterium]
MSRPPDTPEGANEPSTGSPRHNRARDIAVLLPIVALLLFLPPFISVFFSTGLVFGVPMILAYVFGVWLLLILATRRLSRILIETETSR